jgi:acyl phosphate:glycerol-3-phosphate acyltransferase
MRARPMLAPTLRLGGAVLVGSIPFAQAVARAAAGADLRRVGTGTVSATNVYRVAGVRAFALACALDVAKGAVAAALAGRRRPVGTALAAASVVAAHNWSVFLRGAGGRGVLPAMGVLSVAAPSGAALVATGIVAGHLSGDSAPGCLAAQALLVPVLARTHGRSGALLAAAVTVPMLVKRVMGNGAPPARSWRVYLNRMVYDRDVR